MFNESNINPQIPPSRLNYTFVIYRDHSSPSNPEPKTDRQKDEKTKREDKKTEKQMIGGQQDFK